MLVPGCEERATLCVPEYVPGFGAASGGVGVAVVVVEDDTLASVGSGGAITVSGDLSVDLVKRIVRMRDREVKLSPKEYDILRVLVQHAGKVLTHRFILQEVWGGDVDVQYLRVYVRQLRQKIELTPDTPVYITTESGVGYRLRDLE